MKRTKLTQSSPLISVIIPSYNEERDLPECLWSIARQTIASRVEVIVVDDDSTDSTKDIAFAAMEQYGLNVRVIRNGTHDAERGKMIGLQAARGKYWTYMDADMAYRDANYLETAVKPLENWDEDSWIHEQWGYKNGKTFVVGTIASMGCNPRHNGITRCISRDIFQRDPIFQNFTPSIKESVVTTHSNFKENGWHLCWLNDGIMGEWNIPAQSLILYRTDILRKVTRGDSALMDNDILVKFVKNGYYLFAWTPQVRVYHNLLRGGLRELWNKRMRGVLKTFTAEKYFSQRKYKWFQLDSLLDYIKLDCWVIMANLLLYSTFVGLCKTIKHRDMACMWEPLINIVSTDALVWGFLRSGRGASALAKL